MRSEHSPAPETLAAKQLRCDSTQQEPPGPNPLPIVGSIFRLNPKQNILFNFIDLWREFGDLCHVKLGPLHLYIVVKPEHVHHVLVRNPDNYIKGNGYNGFRLLVGQGLVTSDGDLWRQQRRLIQPSFTPRSTANFVDLMVAAIQATIERWEGTVATGQSKRSTSCAWPGRRPVTPSRRCRPSKADVAKS